MKKILIIASVVLISLAALSLLKDKLIASTIELVAGQVLGTSVHIQRMSVGLLTHSVKIHGMTVEQPAGFSDGNLLDVREISVKFDLDQVLKGNIHLYEVVFRLNEMHLIKAKDGKLNVNALKIAQQKQDPDAKVLPFTIDTVVLDLGKVYFWDYTATPVHKKMYDINVHDKTYHDIKSAQQFAALVMLESMTPTKVKSLVNFGFNTVGKVLGTVKDAGNLIKDLIKF